MSDNPARWARLADISRNPAPRSHAPAAGSVEADHALQVDEEGYEAPVYSAIRRIRSSPVMDAAFFDLQGGIDLLSWSYYSHARITDTAITMRWAGLVVVLEGRNLRQLHTDIQRRQVAEFRSFRPELWALPTGNVPIIVRMEILAESACL